MISSKKYTRKMSLQHDNYSFYTHPRSCHPTPTIISGPPLIAVAWQRCHTSRRRHRSRGIAIVGNPINPAPPTSVRPSAPPSLGYTVPEGSRPRHRHARSPGIIATAWNRSRQLFRPSRSPTGRVVGCGRGKYCLVPSIPPLPLLVRSSAPSPLRLYCF